MTNGTFIPKPSVSMVQTVGASVTRVGPCILGPRMEDPLGGGQRGSRKHPGAIGEGPEPLGLDGPFSLSRHSTHRCSQRPANPRFSRLYTKPAGSSARAPPSAHGPDRGPQTRGAGAQSRGRGEGAATRSCPHDSPAALFLVTELPPWRQRGQPQDPGGHREVNPALALPPAVHERLPRMPEWGSPGLGG